MSSNIIIGTPLFDELFGTILDDEIYGLDGDDILWGGDGNDLLDGGNGADQLFGESGNDMLVGGSGDDLLDGGSGDDAMAGGTGDDSYYVDSALDVVTENDSEGTDTVYSTVDYVLSSNVENLVLGGYAISGTGNDQDNYLYGNDGFNILTGGAGNDFLDGGASGDAMDGGTGDDTYMIDDRDDQVFEAIGEGFDTVIVAVNQYVMPYNVEVLQIADHERMFTTAWGNEQDNIMIGLDGKSDILRGLDGDDTLDGGLGKWDNLEGGLGNDSYYVDHFQDYVIELDDAANQPFYDVIYASTDYQIAIGIEELILTGNGDFNATGRDSDDILTGNSGNNLLDGGAGDDVMAGGAGDDVYIVDSAGDTIIEHGNEGRDRIESSVDFLLWRDAKQVEDLTLTGTDHIDAIGSWRHNTIVGNDGNNHITGGKGNDTLTGGGGGDLFFFHKNHGDNVITDFGNGADKIQFAGTSAQSFDDLTIQAVGSGTEVSIDQVTVFLEGVSAASLDAGDFIIS